MRNWHPEDIKTAVRKTGVSLAKLGRRKGLKPNTVQAALRRPQPSGNRAIAKHLGLKVHDIWPAWFDETGNRRPGALKPGRVSSPSRKTSTRRAPRQSKSAAAVNTPAAPNPAAPNPGGPTT